MSPTIRKRDQRMQDWIRKAILFLLASLVALTGFSQSLEDAFPVEYDEFLGYLSVENLGYYEIDAVYAEDEVYLPFLSLCNILSIYKEASSKLDTIQGYLANPSTSFYLNFRSNKAIFRDKEFDLSRKDYLFTYGDVFISAEVYQNLFGFNLSLDFRSLMVRLQSDVELPVVKLLKQKKLRENLKSLNGEVQVDTIFERNFSPFRAGVLDWTFRLSQSTNATPKMLFRGATGAELLGGELIVRGALSNERRFNLRDQNFRWRYINNSSPLVRQVNVGFIGVPLNSQVTTPLIGVGISNVHAGFRKSYGSIMLERKTNPGWEVEVFVNNVLIGFAKADANGEVQIEVPLMYGNTEIQIRYYGPWGEEEIEEQTFVVPFVFVPQGKLEYQAFTGMTRDSLAQPFSHVRAGYGLNRRISLFAGYEHFDRNLVNRSMPFTGASVVLSHGLMMSFQAVHGAYRSGSLLWRSKGGLFVQGQSKVSEEDQDAELNNNLQEHSASFNIPFSLGKTRWLTRGQVRVVKLPNTINRFGELSASVFYKRFNGGFTIGGNFGIQPSIFSAINASIQLPKQWAIQAGTQLQITEPEVNNLALQVQKRINRRAVVNVNINGLQSLSDASFNLSVFIDLGWMGLSSEASRSNKGWGSAQNLSGSTLIGKAPKRFQTNTRSTMGRGAVDVMVYLDINHNDKKDDHEPLLRGIDVSMTRGVESLLENDTVTRFVALEPYTRHLIKVSQSGLQEISWRLPYTTIGVYADVNSVKRVYIPVKPMGEVEGQVIRIDSSGLQFPAPRVPILITSIEGAIVGRVSTDQGGFFNYAELKPGRYLVGPDLDALNRAGLTSTKALEVVIKEGRNGDYLQGINFVVLEIEQ